MMMWEYESLKSPLLGPTMGRHPALLYLSIALSAEEEDDLPLPDPDEPLKDKNNVVPARRNKKRVNVYHEESRSKRIRRVPAKFLQ